MRVLLILADDLELTQYPGGLRKAIDAGLAEGKHDVDVIDLHTSQFSPTMTAEGRRNYHTPNPLVEDDVIGHARLVRNAEAMVFVYRSTWTGLPARLKGFLDRTFVPSVGFNLVDGKVQRALTDVRRLVIIVLHEQGSQAVKQSRDPGRRILTKTLRLIVNTRCNLRYLPVYDCESCTDDAREIKYSFLYRVEKTLAGL